ncbi:MAG TPA: LytTR family DNA-binding domain-containing protein [Saprospiraceae bacterium]|nr:LytTR family DNA-binding domain-containing protein [Saprospiraceae bacterium]
MIKVLIVEDEAVAGRRLQKMLLKQGLAVQGVCGSNRELQSFLDQTAEPDLFFLDIHLSDGIVFDFLQQHELRAPIIFTTAYDQYAIKAFKQNSIDYLLKPIDEEELEAALEKFKKANSPPKVDLQTLSTLLQREQKPEYRSRLLVKVGEHLRTFSVSDLTHFYSAQKITFAHTQAQRSYPIDPSLDQVEQELDPRQFFRVSRSHLINIDYIKDIITFSSSRLKVILQYAEQEEIIVSRDRVKDFKNWLG